jgi:OPA family glycerol-3-phosphate transporter-like MFS transporter
MIEKWDRLGRHQLLTVALLVTGYSGYYLCRSNFSVTLPMIIQDLAGRGLDADVVKIRLGTIASLGILGYALGKFASGAAADFLGGRRNFLSGMLGSVLFTVLFSVGGAFPFFTMAWVCNRLVQSMGWVGMVKVSSRWFSYSRYGAAMGVISLSYLFGDAAARRLLAYLIGAGFTWRAVFQISAAILFALFVITFWLLKETPADLGLEEPPASPLTVYGPEREAATPGGFAALVLPLLQSPAFWMVCLLSLGLTLLRETFLTWAPTYFNQALGLSEADAGARSALFPFFGGISVLLAGFLSDFLGRGGRAAIIFFGLILTSVALFVLGFRSFADIPLLAVGLVSLIGFLMTGPYSYLAGAISLDFGGKQGSATACGIIDGVGYLGGVLAGDSMARISVAFGWQGAFIVLGVCALATGLVAFIFLLEQRRLPVQPEKGQ